MSGFPVRTSRKAFGPKPVDRAPVTSPERALSADLGDLLMWQVAGMSTTAARAFVVIDSTFAIVAAGEAWDPDALYLPVVTKPATGTYQVQYLATYPDKDGNAQATALVAARVSPQTALDRRAHAKVQPDGRTVIAYHRDASGALTDIASGDFLLVEAM